MVCILRIKNENKMNIYNISNMGKTTLMNTEVFF